MAAKVRTFGLYYFVREREPEGLSKSGYIFFGNVHCVLAWPVHWVRFSLTGHNYRNCRGLVNPQYQNVLLRTVRCRAKKIS